MKACVFTLGCKVNEVESASIMSALADRGWEVTDVPEAADLYVLNTCAVTAEAEKKSRQAVARLQKLNPSARVVVCGCAAQSDPQAFAARGAYAVRGAMRKDGVAEAAVRGGILLEEEAGFCELPFPRQTRTRAFLRIQDGCNRFCSYCLIPYLRGRTRSRSAESVLAEARACTAREIVLTGIDIASYRDGDTDLGGLLLKLGELPARIRLGSLEEGAVTQEFLEMAQRAGNVAPHFHLSLQSGSDAVLRRMNRRYTRAEYLRACARIYHAFPDAAITTDIIAGFPGETEEEFAMSLSMIAEAGFARVHAFPYSRRAGTAAAKLPDLPAAVKKERTARLLAAAQRAEQAYLDRFIGRTLTALFEEDGGYTQNYIRVYAEGAEEGGMYAVKPVARERDGCRAVIVKKL